MWLFWLRGWHCPHRKNHCAKRHLCIQRWHDIHATAAGDTTKAYSFFGTFLTIWSEKDEPRLGLKKCEDVWMPGWGAFHVHLDREPRYSQISPPARTPRKCFGCCHCLHPRQRSMGGIDVHQLFGGKHGTTLVSNDQHANHVDTCGHLKSCKSFSKKYVATAIASKHEQECLALSFILKAGIGLLTMQSALTITHPTEMLKHKSLSSYLFASPRVCVLSKVGG